MKKFDILPWNTVGNLTGESNEINGCPNKFGIFWKAILLLLSIIKNNGLRKNGYKSPGNILWISLIVVVVDKGFFSRVFPGEVEFSLLSSGRLLVLTPPKSYDWSVLVFICVS